MKNSETEIVHLRLSKQIMGILRTQAKSNHRTISRQLEALVLAGSSIIEATQPFILAVFPKGADEEDIDRILKTVGNMQIGAGPDKSP